MNKTQEPEKFYDVHIIDGEWCDDVAPEIYFHLVSKEETEALLSIALRQRDMKILISNGRA